MFPSFKISIVEMKRMDRSQYFQSITHHFLKLRGAPFFLSSKELSLIETWESMKIPVQVVLEGIDRTFEKNRLKSGNKRGKVSSLVFCNPQVLRAFEQFRDRRIGTEKKAVEREEKREKARAEIKKFLKNTPREIAYLKETYSEVLKLLSLRNISEDELEQKEREIEDLLFEKSSDEEKEKVKKKILSEYEFKRKEEFQRIFKLRLLRILRERHKIPYVSLYYY